MTRYGSGGTSEVAALSLGDGEHADTRQRAVEAALGVLERWQGSVTSVPVGTLRDAAWAADGGETAASACEAWSEYVRPALAVLETVENVQPGRWRYAGRPDRAATRRQAGDPGTADHDPSSADEGNGDRGDPAALSDAAQAGVGALEAVKEGDGNAALAAALLDMHDDGNAALADDDRDADPEPETDVGKRVAAGEAGSQARIERRARREAAREAREEAALSSSAASNSSGPTCARCDDVLAADAVDAPVLDARFAPGDRLCADCFAALAAGQQRVDGLDG
jgi:hypothetical protein